MQEYIGKSFSTVVIIRDPLERSISHYLWSIARGYINKNEDVAVLVSYGSKQHDPKDEDTYRRIAYKTYNIKTNNGINVTNDKFG